MLRYLRPFVELYKIDLKGFDDRRYRELGGVLATVVADDVKMALQTQGREMGGDGVIALCYDHGMHEEDGNRLTISNGKQEVVGTVIKFLDKSCMS